MSNDKSAAQGFDNRIAFAETLIKLASSNPRIVAVASDSAGSSNLNAFKAAFPDRLVNVGIAEQDLVGVGAGLANAGLIPFICAASCFLTARAMEQIKVDIAYSNTPAILCGMSPGIAYGELGPTHHSIEDLAWLRVLPNITIAVPADAIETEHVVRWAAQANQPTFIRVSRHKVPLLQGTERKFRPGTAHTLAQGEDITIVALGTMVSAALEASKLLKTKGVSARVIHVTTLKPLDDDLIIKAARETGRIVTVEEASTIGGLGGAVAELLAQVHPTPMRMIGIPGIFAPTGNVDFLFERFGMTPEGIAETCLKF